MHRFILRPLQEWQLPRVHNCFLGFYRMVSTSTRIFSFRVLMFVFLGAGFVTLPYDFIMLYINRPLPIKEAQFEVEKSVLLNNILSLRTLAREYEVLRP